MEKDQKSIEKDKERLINEIKRIDKDKMFESEPKEKITILTKTLKILGLKK